MEVRMLCGAGGKGGGGKWVSFVICFSVRERISIYLLRSLTKDMCMEGKEAIYIRPWFYIRSLKLSYKHIEIINVYNSVSSYPYFPLIPSTGNIDGFRTSHFLPFFLCKLSHFKKGVSGGSYSASVLSPCGFSTFSLPLQRTLGTLFKYFIP